ncbi:hypothetical protein ACFO4N_00360 [Camelliibacillus cellulosilyticus]|uniref:Uncharacterized protein n=2 Tax=Camelliibacillus cellulosilyticus TaxID=2174486 RepID=A0ABV9GGY5_9BACL
MNRQWIGEHMRIVVMDWKKGEIITLMDDELENTNIDKELKHFMIDMLPILQKPLWKSRTEERD